MSLILFYRYMLTIQQDALKSLIKKQVPILYGTLDSGIKPVVLATPDGISAFIIPNNLFMLNDQRLKDCTQMFSEIINADEKAPIKETQEIMCISQKTQVKKFVKDNEPVYVNCKFLDCFKGIKGMRYEVAHLRRKIIVYAYDENNNMLGFTLAQPPK